MATILERIPQEQIEAAKRVDLLTLAEQYTTLQRKSSREYAGPCPKCGGDDRFHVSSDWFFCRQCHAKRGDSIEFLRWLRPDLSFSEAVAGLAASPSLLTAAAKRAPYLAPPLTRTPRHGGGLRPKRWWRQHTAAMVRSGCAGAGLPVGAWVGAAYLAAIRVGLYAGGQCPGTGGRQQASAIVFPWYAGGKLVAVRFRFLDPPGKRKITALPGSRFAGKLFGGQHLTSCALRHRWLAICEGETNAMSCWQVANQTGLDVLSLGSESAKLSPKAIQVARQYRQVLLWVDRERVAQQLLSVLPGAVGIRSPGGKDANDLLRAGLLGGFLATMRASHAKNPTELEALLWALYDAATPSGHPLGGIDTSTAQVLRRLAGKLGKRAAIYEAEPNRWIAEKCSNIGAGAVTRA